MFNADIRTPEGYLDKAIRRGRKTYRSTYNSLQYGSKLKKKKIAEQARFQTIFQILQNDLGKIIDEFPRLSDLPVFYQDLIPLVVDYKQVRNSIVRLKYILRIISKIYSESIKKLKESKNINEINKIRREYYGRIASLLKRNRGIFEILKEASKKLRRLPKIKDLPTVVIAGLPNVGKSTLLKKLTGSEPEIQPYPFTTKNIMIGYIRTPYTDIQVIDTPGILDRDFEELNNIERRSLVAIKDLANLIIYVIDPTEFCGYTIESQWSLLSKIKSFFEQKEIYLYFSKKDLKHEKYEENKQKTLEKFPGFIWFDNSEKLKQALIGWMKEHRELIR